MMKGYDKQEALEFILARIHAKDHPELADSLADLISQTIDADMAYMHEHHVIDEEGGAGTEYYEDDEAFEYMVEKLAEQAKEKPFVIIGRCADFILRDNDDALNVFIYASREKRLERLGKYPIYGQIENPEQAMKKKDKRRASNYRQRTGQEWGLIENYHVALDSGVLGLTRCVDVLELLASRERA